MGMPLNGPNSRKGWVFVFGESSETIWKGEERKELGRMGLRGLPAFVHQVKWPDSEKPAEKLILIQRDPALIPASGRKESKSASNYIIIPDSTVIIQFGI